MVQPVLDVVPQALEPLAVAVDVLERLADPAVQDRFSHRLRLGELLVLEQPPEPPVSVPERVQVVGADRLQGRFPGTDIPLQRFDLVDMPMLRFRKPLRHPLRLLQRQPDRIQPLPLFLPDGKTGQQEQDDDQGRDDPRRPFAVPFPGGREPLPFRHGLQIIPLRPAHRLGSLGSQDGILPQRAPLQQGQRLLRVPFQAIAVVLPVLQLHQSFGMLPVQAVPETERPVFLAGQVQGISPVAKPVVVLREPGGRHRLEAAGGERRIAGRGGQLVGRVDVHSVTDQGAVPQADRKDLLQQPVRLVPLPGVHVGADQAERRFRPVQVADVVGPVVHIGHGAADEALQVAVPHGPRMQQRPFERYDRLVILSPVIRDQSPLIPEPGVGGGIPLRREIGQGRGEQVGIDSVGAGLIQPDDRVQGLVGPALQRIPALAADQHEKQAAEKRDLGFHCVLSLGKRAQQPASKGGTGPDRTGNEATVLKHIAS